MLLLTKENNFMIMKIKKNAWKRETFREYLINYSGAIFEDFTRFRIVPSKLVDAAICTTQYLHIDRICTA